MKQQLLPLDNHLLKPIPEDKLNSLTKEELLILHRGDQQIIRTLNNEVEELRELKKQTEQKSMFLEEQYVTIINKMFGKSSERSPKQENKPKTPGPRKKKVQLPSLRYPDAPLIEREVVLDNMPSCSCCGKEMEDSGMTEDSESLTAIPRQFFVLRTKRHKYRCSCCHGDLVTAPQLPKIKKGGSYNDDMIIDAAMSKYCDLIPIDRYVQMAARSGIKGLPANSLIQATHNLANFVELAYDKIEEEVIASKVMKADETPHRMLEGDKKSNWYLWGFSTDKACYFEAHNTRSGDVASNMLKKSKCEYLMSDVYSGYAKAVRLVNEIRKEKHEVPVINIYCNAHARRKFKESIVNFAKEAELFIWCYKRIYRLESCRGDPDCTLTFEYIRKWQKLYFQFMERQAIAWRNSYSTKSSIGKAFSYFLKNHEGFTLFLEHKNLPIDNNSQERLMRDPVIGRKTWYGNHSKKGVRTATILFSLVESCKLNKVNPRKYFPDLVEALHQGKPAFTPAEYAKIA